MAIQDVLARLSSAPVTRLVRFRPRRRHVVLGLAYAAALLAVVLLPIGPLLDAGVLRLATAWPELGLPGRPTPDDVGAGLNVVMFVPLGYLAVRLSRRPWWQVTLLGAALSTCVELYQALPMVPRHPSVGDVVTNTIGAALGALLASYLLRRAGRAVRIPEQRRP